MKNKAPQSKSPQKPQNLKRIKIAKLMVLLGTIILWLPVLLTVVTSIIGSIANKAFLCDYLMPAELFPVAAFGSIVVIIGAYLSQTRHKLLCISSLIMTASLAAGQFTAVYTGLASGETAAEGIVYIIVLALIALYSVFLLVNCVTGILIIKKLFKK